MSDNEKVNNEPDVNITSWILVEKSRNDSNSDFYFKNETSSVQELTEGDLGSTESNSDSDDISVISETEDNLQDCCTCLQKIRCQDDSDVSKDNASSDCDNEDVSEQREEIEMIDLYDMSDGTFIFLLGIVSFCLAIVSILLYYNMEAPNILPDNRPDADTTYDDTIFYDDIYFELVNPYEFNNSCVHKVDLGDLKPDFHSVKQLVPKTYDNIISDISLPVMKSLNLQHSNFDLTSVTDNKKTINQKVNKNGFQDKHSNTNKNIKSNKSKNKAESQTLKLKENYLNKKDKYLTKKEKYLKKLEKHISQLETRLRKIHQRIRKNGNKNEHNKDKQKKIKKGNIKKSNYPNMTGEWYQKMYFGRSEMRQKEKISEWMFDRSKMRSKLRDKAYWYFNRASGREDFRSNIQSEKRKTFRSYRF